MGPPKLRPPLNHMRIRGDNPSNLFAAVRDGGPPHQGWDLAAEPLTPVYAVANGTVVASGFDIQRRTQTKVTGTYGKHVTIKLERADAQPLLVDGKQLFAFYAHLSHLNVGNGQWVREGTQIGLSGITGYPFKEHHPVVPKNESHLHFEFRNADPPGEHLKGRVDPAKFWPHQLATVRH